MDVKFGAPSIHSLQDLEIPLPHWIIFIANIFCEKLHIKFSKFILGVHKKMYKFRCSLWTWKIPIMF